MYNLSDIKSLHLEVTSKCQARCPMCPRRIYGGPMRPGVTLDEIDLETFITWFPKDFIRQLDHLFMCGNLGDPLLAKNTVEIFRYCREINEYMSLAMHTNGSGRNRKWWKSLVEIKVKVVFGIDGLEDTHSLYRINTDWKKIIKNAKTFINAGGEAFWDMLVFAHNEHQVDDCEKMSKQLGFKEFSIKHTTRFNEDGECKVLNDDHNIINILYPSYESKKMIIPKLAAIKEMTPTINCKAVAKNMLYVSTLGVVTPCCWLDNSYMIDGHESVTDYLNKIKIWPNLNDTSLKDIFASGYFDLIALYWDGPGLKECSTQCGLFDQSYNTFNARRIFKT